jgi:TP901 family phage tail tape measure protein
MNQFELQTSDASRVINVLAAGSKVGASEIAETANAVTRAGVAMKLAGVSFEEGNAAIQILAKNGILAERAGTQLKTALLKLTSEGIDAINPKVVGLNKALDNLGEANLDAATLTDLFGLEAVAAGKILIDNRKLLGDWTKQMTDTNTATVQAATNMDTFAERSKRLVAIITADFIKVFQDNESTLSQLVDQMIIDFEKFRPIQKIFHGIANAIELVIRGTQTLAEALGRFSVNPTLSALFNTPDVSGTMSELIKENPELGAKFAIQPELNKTQADITVRVKGPASVESVAGDASVNVETDLGGMLPAF